MNRKAWVSVGLALLLLLTPVAMAGGTISSYHETESELTNASTQTNLDLQGSGDEAEFFYAPPDLREDTAAEFQNGTSSNVTIEGTGESAVVAYDGFVVGATQTTDTEFNNGTLTNVSVEGTGDSASVVFNPSATFTDSFEDGSLSEYQNAGNFGTTTNRAYSGSVSLNKTGPDGQEGTYSTEASAPASEKKTATIWWYYDADERGGAYLTDSNGAGYVAYVDPGDTFGIREAANTTSFNTGFLNQTGSAPGLTSGNWYKIEIVHDGSDGLTARIETTSGSVVSKVSASDQSVDPTMAGAWAFDTGTIYDDLSLTNTGSGGTTGQFISEPFSADRVEGGAVNFTALSNTTGTVIWQHDDDGDGTWTNITNSSYTTAGEYNTTFSNQFDTVRVRLDFNATDGDSRGELNALSILFIEQGEYQSQPREAPEATSAWVDLKLPDTTNATVTVEGYDGSTWTALANKKFTSTGNKSLSIGSGYQKYRTRVNYDRSADGAKAELDDLGYDAVKTGVYVGQNHTLANASQVFVALELHNATANTTVEAYNSSSGSWENVGGFSTSSSVFDSRNISNTTMDTYRVRLRVSPNSNAANATLTAEGLIAGDETVVKQVTERTADSTPLLLALSDSPQSEADSIISSLPLTALPDYYQAQITRQIRDLFGFEDSTTAAKEASGVTGFYNNNSGSFTAYINNQISGEEVAIRNYDTIQISFNINGENSTVYWLGLVDDGQFATTTIENTTSREVDQTLILSGHLAVKSEEELRTAHESFVTTGETPSEGYVAALKGQYGADASGTLINETAT